MTHRSLFILTWDEGMNGTDNRIVTLMVGEMVRPGRYAERIDHYTVLRTLLEMYGLAPIALTTNRDPITSSWMPGTAGSPVSVALTSPAAGAAYPGPATISLVAEAASSNGAIAKVEFYEREHFLGKVSSAPFSL